MLLRVFAGQQLGGAGQNRGIHPFPVRFFCLGRRNKKDNKGSDGQ